MLKSFGRLPAGERLHRIESSPHFNNGSFKNLAETRMIAADVSYWNLTLKYLTKGADRVPAKTLPSVKTDLSAITEHAPVIVWFGHSSYFIRFQNKNILVDPVFSRRASPIQFIGMKSYEVSHPYEVSDIPEIDVLILTHDHYDHLDYETILGLKSRVKTIITTLGVGAHLNAWGIGNERMRELDWWETSALFTDTQITCTPSRHFSGRSLTRNRSLWGSFVLKIQDWTLFLGGDSGYDRKQFQRIGENFGPFDIAILECGQYNTAWPYIHMAPEQTVQASLDLRAKALLPVHWGKFTLALHAWYEPIQRAVAAADKKSVRLITPRIGEPVVLGDHDAPVSRWWEEVM